MPGINDDPRQVEEILEACAAAGATGVGGIALHLRGEVREIFMEWLRSYRPDLVPRYEQLYARGAYAPKPEQQRLQALLHRSGLRFPSRFDGDDRKREVRGPLRPPPSAPAPPRRRGSQESLF